MLGNGDMIHMRCAMNVGIRTVGNGRKTHQPFFIYIFEYESESERGKEEHEN